MRLLVTGGAGFIGSNFVHYELAHDPGVRIVNLDKLTYAENLADVAEDPRYAFLQGDVAEPADVERAFHLCEERFGGGGCGGGGPLRGGVARGPEHRGRGALPADERAGDARAARGEPEAQGRALHPDLHGRGLRLARPGRPAVHRGEPSRPNSPYAASKAAADLLVRSYVQTYGFPATITCCSNNFGPYQFPEKLIPLAITFALEGKPVPVYGDGQNVRDWIYVEDHCRGIDLALRRGRPGAVYNFGARSERANLDLVRDLLRLLGRPDDLFAFVPDRPGHDRRYAIDPPRA